MTRSIALALGLLAAAQLPAAQLPEILVDVMFRGRPVEQVYEGQSVLYRPNHRHARIGKTFTGVVSRTLQALLAIALCAGCGRGADLDVSRAFQEAQKTFDNAQSPDDFLRAAGLYQSILDRGVISGVVLYNQGNAYMQAGHRGRAIAAYRLAKRYRPRDPYVEANLRYALGAEKPAGGRRPVVQYVLFWQDWLSYPEKFYLVGAAAVVTLALAVTALYWRRRLPARLAIVGLVLVLLSAFSAGYDWHRYEHMAHGVVVQKGVIARKGNAASYEPAFTEPLAEGTEFRLVERRADWLLIRMPGGEEGWIQQEGAVTY